jgi:hypothetical protein
MTCVSFGLPVKDWYWQGEVEARVVASAPIEFTRGKGEIDSGVLAYLPCSKGKGVYLFSTSGAAKKSVILNVGHCTSLRLHHMSRIPSSRGREKPRGRSTIINTRTRTWLRQPGRDVICKRPMTSVT